MKYTNTCMLDSILFTCTLYLCKVTGIVPCKVEGKRFTLQEILGNTAGFQRDPVQTTRSIPLNGLAYIVTHMSFTVLWFFNIGYSFTSIGMRGFLMLGVSAAYLIVIIALFKRTSIMRCINSAAKVYCMSSLQRHKLEVTAFLTLFSSGFVVPMIAVISHLDFTHIMFTSINEITSMPILAVSLLISSLCIVCERAFIHINQQLTELSGCHLSSRTKCQLEVLVFQFEIVTDVVAEIINCFGLMLATILTEFTVCLVILSYFLSRNSPNMHLGLYLIMCSTYLAIYSLKFSLICKCSQQLKNQMKAMSMNLYSLKVHWLDNGDESLQTMLSDFSDCVDSTPVVLSAAGFTEIDLSLLVKLIGTATMYASAAIGLSSTAGK